MRIKTFIIAIGGLAGWVGCSPRIYRPPALGAEYRFDEGLAPQKPKQRLFSPDMQRALEKSGQAPAPAQIQRGGTAVAKRDSTGNLLPAAKAARTDTLTNPVPPASQASQDSSRNDLR